MQMTHIRARVMSHLLHILTLILRIIGAEFTLFKRICVLCSFSFALWISILISSTLTLNRMCMKRLKSIIRRCSANFSKRLKTVNLSLSAQCMLSLIAIFRVPKVLFVSAFTVKKHISVCLANMSIMLGCPMCLATAGLCLKSSKKAVLIILFQTKCQLGMIQTVFLIIILYGKVLTEAVFMLVFRLPISSLGMLRLKFRRIGKHI